MRELVDGQRRSWKVGATMFVAFGVALGLGFALLAGRWIQPLLFQQSARDPATFGMVAALLLAVAPVASTLPAVRATRADPNSALRGE